MGRREAGEGKWQERAHGTRERADSQVHGHSGDQITRSFVPRPRRLDLNLGKSKVTEGLEQQNSDIEGEL